MGIRRRIRRPKSCNFRVTHLIGCQGTSSTVQQQATHCSIVQVNAIPARFCCGMGCLLMSFSDRSVQTPVDLCKFHRPCTGTLHRSQSCSGSSPSKEVLTLMHVMCEFDLCV